MQITQSVTYLNINISKTPVSIAIVLCTLVHLISTQITQSVTYLNINISKTPVSVAIVLWRFLVRVWDVPIWSKVGNDTSDRAC